MQVDIISLIFIFIFVVMGLTLFIYGMYACIKLKRNRNETSELRIDHLIHIKTVQQGFIYVILGIIVIAGAAHFYLKVRSNAILFDENRNLRVSLEKISLKSISEAELALKEASLSLEVAVKAGAPIIEVEQYKEKLKDLEARLSGAKAALARGEFVPLSEELVGVEKDALQISEQIKKAIEKTKMPPEKTKR